MWSPNWRQSDHEKLKRKRAAYLAYAAFTAVAVTGLGAVLSPPYIPTPYQMVDKIIPALPPIGPTVIRAEPASIKDPEPVSRTFVEDDSADPSSTIDPTGIFTPPAPLKQNEVQQYTPIPETLPALLHYEIAEYPDMALSMEATGEIAIKVLVDENGKVVDAIITTSNVSEALEMAALTAANRCLFVPARQNNRPVKCWVMLSYFFTLE